MFRSFIDVAQSALLPLLTAADAAAAELSLQLMLQQQGVPKKRNFVTVCRFPKPFNQQI